jgi:hypothetical protein
MDNFETDRAVRVNVSVPTSIYRQMKQLDDAVKTNWSQIATAAFSERVAHARTGERHEDNDRRVNGADCRP